MAVSANLCVAALGTETDGSIVCPAHINGIVGVKPTVGLTSRAGRRPDLAHAGHDRPARAHGARRGHPARAHWPGPIRATRRPRAGAARLDGDGDRPASTTRASSTRTGCAARASASPRKLFFGYSAPGRRSDRGGARALRAARAPSSSTRPTSRRIDEINASPDELTVLLYELKADLNAVSARARVRGPGTRANCAGGAHPRRRDRLQRGAREGGDAVLRAGAVPAGARRRDRSPTRPTSRRSRRPAGGAAREGIDAVLDRYQPRRPRRADRRSGLADRSAQRRPLPRRELARRRRSPAIRSSRCRRADAFGLPVGLTFMGRAWSEPMLLRLAYAFEQASRARRAPRFLTAIEEG